MLFSLVFTPTTVAQMLFALVVVAVGLALRWRLLAARPIQGLIRHSRPELDRRMAERAKLAAE